MPDRLLRLSPNDHVAVALTALEPGETLSPFSDATVRDPVPAGHKVALRPVGTGEQVLPLGQPIGIAARLIAAGEHVHMHNLDYPGSLAGHTITVTPPPALTNREPPTFLGYRRDDGRVGTRNYIGVLTTVNCAAGVAHLIANRFADPAWRNDHPHIDGVVALSHGSGCSVSDGSPSMDMLRRVLAGYARHPNFAGVLIVGLGCEDNLIELLCEQEGLELGGTVRSLTIQEVGGTRATADAGAAIVREIMAETGNQGREPFPVSQLCVGLQCGGSDSFSGISANPALGVAADILVGYGGTAILSETPEIYGAENLLLQRVASEDVGRRLIELLDWWKDYTAHEPKGFDNNPSPGNRAGGLTTILEKSLGALSKGGSTTLMEVYPYAEAVRKRGLVFMDSPGYDPISVTGQIAGGANLICFTTGRGSCFGCRPSPSLKIATNSAMYRRMQDDMDVNCGTVLDGEASLEEAGQAIFEAMVRTASGAPTKSELLGYGEHEFLPWHVNAWV
ncbi:MAG: altronate dehydratase family protein [Nitratireductor sp.]